MMRSYYYFVTLPVFERVLYEYFELAIVKSKFWSGDVIP